MRDATCSTGSSFSFGTITAILKSWIFWFSFPQMSNVHSLYRSEVLHMSGKWAKMGENDGLMSANMSNAEYVEHHASHSLGC